MNSKLKQIQKHIIKYTEIISSILNVDVEVIDNRLYRVGGTGIYKDKIGSNILLEGYIYNEVLEKGKQKIILDVAYDSTCEKCENYEKCKSKTIIAYPIIYKNIAIGVIGAISTHHEQKENIKRYLKYYLEFIDRISNLIAKEIENHEMFIDSNKKIEVLKSVLDEVERGVIILDVNNNISFINDIAIKKINIKESLIGENIDIYFTENVKQEQGLLNIKINNNMYKIDSKIIPVIPSVNKYDKIIIFNKIYEQNNSKEESNSKWGEIDTNNIIGSSPSMLEVKKRLKKLAKSKSTVLITGESGTGKELIARAIHAEGIRRNKPFIAINCAAIPETLLESELFGYVKGAFSGANNNGKIGKFELANEGVIFLDEIGDLPLHLQAKLLRVLQERKFTRIGSNKLIDLDIRIIAATNKDLLKLVEEGKFRDDLYYRLNIIPINLPPLRERKEDIKDITMKFIHDYSIEFDLNISHIEENVINSFINYNWPGNIRELQNSVEYMMNIIGDDGIISYNMLPLDILRYFENKEQKIYKHKDKLKNNLDKTAFNTGKIYSLKEVEIKYINKLLDIYGRDTNTKKEIAKKLGIGLSTLYRKLEEI